MSRSKKHNTLGFKKNIYFLFVYNKPEPVRWRQRPLYLNGRHLEYDYKKSSFVDLCEGFRSKELSFKYTYEGAMSGPDRRRSQ